MVKFDSPDNQRSQLLLAAKLNKKISKDILTWIYDIEC
jgi:hypothetical protein